MGGGSTLGLCLSLGSSAPLPPQPGSKVQNVRPPSGSVLTSCVTRACHPPSVTHLLVCLHRFQGHRDTISTKNQFGSAWEEVPGPLPRKEPSPAGLPCPPSTRPVVGCPGAPQDARRSGVPVQAPAGGPHLAQPLSAPRPAPTLGLPQAAVACIQVIKARRSHLMTGCMHPGLSSDQHQRQAGSSHHHRALHNRFVPTLALRRGN